MTTIDGPVTVEVIDEMHRAETPDDVPYAPKEMTYDKCEILESGWVKCIGPGHEDESDDERSVDYYPPGRLNGLYVVEEES
jgi:hypothetical protein